MDRYKRGRDLLPKDMTRVRHLEGTFRETAIRRGYEEIETSTIEPLSLFTRAGTLDPQTLTNLYSFLDWDGWSGERVVLRPEGTIPAVRLFIEHFSKSPGARLFYTAHMFSYDDEGTSEHLQCGAELIERAPAKKSEADSEIISFSLEALKKLGFPSPLIRVGYPPLIGEILALSPLLPEEKHEVILLIRERDIEGLKRALTQKRMTKLLGLLELTSSSADFLKNISSYLPKSSSMKKTLREFIDSVEALSDRGIDFEINFTLPLNFEYYTGLVMEAYPSPEKTQKRDLIASGGRYDNLIHIMSDGAIPAGRFNATGFALRGEHIIEHPQFIKSLAEKSCLVKPEADYSFACEIVSLLRDKRYNAEISGAHQDREQFRWIISFDSDTVYITDADSGTVKTIARKKVGRIGDYLPKT